MAPTQAQVARRNIIGYELLHANLYTPPEAMANITVSYNAPVETVAVQVGERVNEGQLILKLQAQDVQDALSSAKATLTAAQSAYVSAEAQYGQPVRDALQQLQQAQSAEKQARLQTEPGGDATNLQSAEQARQQAQQTLDQARAQEQSQLVEYKQQLDQAQAALAAAKSSAHEQVVAAPITGTVETLSVQPGEQVGSTPGQVVGTIVNLDDIEVKATLSDAQLSMASVGTPVTLVFADLPQRVFSGRIASIRSFPAANGATEHEATITFRNTDHLVKPTSTLSRAGIKIGEVRDAISVPVGAIQKDSTGRLFVNVLVNGKWNSTPVQVGLTDGQYTQVKYGLKVGQTVQVR
jgi:RND family efflux transporter MFP subunit